MANNNKPAESSSNRRKGWTTDLSPPPSTTESHEKVSEVATVLGLSHGNEKYNNNNNAFGSPPPPQFDDTFEKAEATKSANDSVSSLAIASSSSSSASAFRRHLPSDNGISHARQRIRAQAKLMVEQRKLAKRMSMIGQMEERNVPENEEEIAREDAAIEQSIKLGAKYVGEGQLYWEEQQANEKHAEGDDVERGQIGGHKVPLVTLARPVQQSAEKETKFMKMLKWEPHMKDIMERRMAQIDRREGTDEQTTNIASLDVGDQSPHFWSDQSLLRWSTPISWSRWVRQCGTRQWAGRAGTRLCVDIHRLEFDHHWLFTGVEVRERTLLHAFESFVRTHERALKAAKQWLMARQAEDDQPQQTAEHDQVVREGEDKQRRDSQLDAFLGNVLRVQKELNLSVKVLQRAWDAADQTHGRFVLHRLEGHAEIFEEKSEGGVPMELRDFFRSPMFLLSERSESAEATSNEARTPAAAVDNEAQQRRQAVVACHYQVQLFFNDLIVCASEPVALHWPSFCVPFGRIFDLQVFERPEQIRIRLLERLSRMAKWQEIAEIFVPLPAEGKTNADDSQRDGWPLIGLQFASTVHRGGFKGSLGCGGQGGAVPFMHGRLFCALKVIGETDETFGERHKCKTDTDNKAISTSGRPPRSPSLFPYGSILCSAHNLCSDLRLNALEKRWLDRHNRPQLRIGFDDEIIAEKKAEMVEQMLPQLGSLKQKGADFGLEARQRAGRKMALALRRHLYQSDEQWHRGRDPSELVREEPLPSLSLFPQLLFSRRPLDITRRLKPMRRHPLLSLRGPILSEKLNKRRLILNIQFASFIPKRIDGVSPSRIFLRFSTKANSVSTSTVDGRQANWQETLVLEVPNQQQEGSATDDEVEEDNNCLKLDMFDVQVRPMERDDRTRDTRHEREERRWLGTARVPLSGLVALGKVDGHLTLQSPIFQTGYRSHPIDHPITVRLLITVDPSPFVPPLPASVNQFGDSADLIYKGTKFENGLRQRFPGQRILAIVCSTDGKRFIASSFLRPVAPPAQIVSVFASNPKQAVSMAAQICASVPILVDSDGLVPATKTPIWSTVDEILRYGTASADDLGTLLCCWLLGLQLSALLLIAPSLPGGPNSTAVLVKFSAADGGDQWLIIPTNGHHFDPSDPTCPLLTVGSIVSSDNVYANLQNALHPSQMGFDLAKRAHWEPLLPPSTGALRAGIIPSVQPNTLNYGEAEEKQLMELRASLERDIRLHFDQARPFAIPQWNMLASRILRELLADSLKSYPDHAGSVSRFVDIESRLEQLRPAFRPSALSFRVPFLSRAQIVHCVLNTQVHLNSEPQAQFALAIHLQPMVGDILGCAVAICTLMPNTNIH